MFFSIKLLVARKISQALNASPDRRQLWWNALNKFIKKLLIRDLFGKIPTRTYRVISFPSVHADDQNKTENSEKMFSTQCKKTIVRCAMEKQWEKRTQRLAGWFHISVLFFIEFVAQLENCTALLVALHCLLIWKRRVMHWGIVEMMFRNISPWNCNSQGA